MELEITENKLRKVLTEENVYPIVVRPQPTPEWEDMIHQI